MQLKLSAMSGPSLAERLENKEKTIDAVLFG
jgi:hypothetical protein